MKTARQRQLHMLPSMPKVEGYEFKSLYLPCANVSGDFYSTGATAREEMVDILARQVASPVLFVKGLRTLYEAGARVFVEVGPKKALQGFPLEGGTCRSVAVNDQRLTGQERVPPEPDATLPQFTGLQS